MKQKSHSTQPQGYTKNNQHQNPVSQEYRTGFVQILAIRALEMLTWVKLL